MGKKIDDYRKLPTFQTKTIPTFVKSIDEAQGIVEHVVSVFGMIDDGGDIVQPGSFAKTIYEHGTRVKVLDQHQTDSALRVVGRPLSLREIGKDELPFEVLQQFPDANGGLLAKTQYAMKTDNGRNMFELVSGGFLPETSIGYDALDVAFENREVDGKEVPVRLLNTIRLWEYSNVIWGMCAATFTLSAKELQMDAKVEQAFNAWTQNADGTPLYAIVGSEESSLLIEDHKEQRYRVPFEIGENEITFMPVSEWLPEEKEANEAADPTTPSTEGVLESDITDKPEQEQKIGRAISAARMGRIRGAIDAVQAALGDLGAMLEEVSPREEAEQHEDEEKTEPQGEQDTSDTHQEPPDEAGPIDESPTSKDELLAEIEQALAEIESMEVKK
jgi:HK97 family phage prohead protease